MTEKIARRGVYTRDSYEPDILRKLTVKQVIRQNPVIISAANTIKEVRDFFAATNYKESHFIVINHQETFEGTGALADIYNQTLKEETPVSVIVKPVERSVKSNDSLQKAMQIMSLGEEELLPVLSEKSGLIIGLLTHKDILNAYKHNILETQEAGVNLSLKKTTDQDLN